MTIRLERAALACVFALSMGRPAAAQLPPDGPVVFKDGLVTFGGNVSATFGPEDTGFFNYTDYEDSTLRMLRLDATAALRVSRRVSVLGEVRSQNIDAPHAYALFARIRPWTDRRFDLQVGRIPPTFGAFPRRSYEADNPLIGYPLAYQYLTSLRADALPSTPDELLAMRGRGWLAAYSIGNPVAAPGVPLATAFRWDTGIQGHFASEVIELTGAITTGTLSNPRFRDDNSGRQIAARVEVHPLTGIVAGVSGAHGAFVSDEAARSAAVAFPASAGGSFPQTAWGADLEFARGYYVIRAETVFSEWRLPTIAEPLQSLGTLIEGRYKLKPGLYVAGRFDRLGFSEITGRSDRVAWEAPVTRVEAGVGYSIERNVLVKVSGQYNDRNAGRTHRARMVAAQVVYWF